MAQRKIKKRNKVFNSRFLSLLLIFILIIVTVLTFISFIEDILLENLKK